MANDLQALADGVVLANATGNESLFLKAVRELLAGVRELRTQPAAATPCQDASMGEHACANRAQCWEPCGELGHSAEHARVAPAAMVPVDEREAIKQIIIDHLTSTYICTRVWQAWSVGTMSEDDFVVAAETELPDELADALLARAVPAAPAAPMECKRCGLAPDQHTGAHWCDNQSFAAPAAQATPQNVAPPNDMVVSFDKALQAQPGDAAILALNAGEVYFSESPTKFPASGHGTQYHAGAPGVIAFARALLSRYGATPQEPVAPDDEAIADAWITASDVDGIAYDGPSFERGYRLGEIAERDRTAPQAGEDERPVAWRETVERAAGDIAYAIFNLANKRLEELAPGISESTDPVDTALIAERNLRALLATPQPAAQAAPAVPLNYVAASKIAFAVLEQYRIDQPKWWRRMDGTPILNDLPSRMAVAFADAGLTTQGASHG